MLSYIINLRPCRNCDKEFAPARRMQVCCTPRCAITYTRAAGKAKKAAERAMDRARREKLKTIADRIAEAQIAFNAYIRLRDRDKGCFVCGQPFSDAPGRVQHAGHVRSRGAAGHLRFTEDNCLGECEGCNGPHGAKPHEIKAGAIRRIGQKRFDELENDNTPHKWTHPELIRIKAEYKAKAAELRKELEDGQAAGL